MKKKLIFVTEALWLGGLEISLINILENLDYKLYDVTVLALRNYQDLAFRIPKQCELLIADRQNNASFSEPYRYRRIYGLMEEPQNATKFRRFIWKVLCLILKAPESILWANYIKNRMAGEKYDTAVIYDNRTAETAVRAIHASRYLMFYHQGIMSHAYHDIFGWKKAEKIIAVSEPIAHRLKSFMPKYADKVIAINNLLDVESVKQKSMESADVQFDNTQINIVSCGRLSREKGMHIALDACAKLKERGLTNFSWYFIGGGREEANLQQQIDNLQIGDCAFLLGQKDNPFPYMRQADLFVQTSLFESYGLSLAEAMILGLPVVSTRTDGAVALSRNGELGLLCDIDPVSVADAVASLLEAPEKLHAWKEAVAGVDFEEQNITCIEKLTRIL